MQAQTTTRMAGPNGLVIALLAIVLAVLTIVAASKISEIGQSSDPNERQSLVQAETISDPPTGIGPNTNVAPAAAAGVAGVAPLAEDLRFLELNTILPGYGSAGTNRLSVNEILFLEANLHLPGPNVQPGGQLLVSDILFLEANLLLPGMNAQEEVRSAEETHFIEMNTHLPGTETGSYTGKLPRE